MARGGKRAGSGRKRTRDTPAGQLNQALILRALKEGTTPLDVMLEAMREAYEAGGAKAAMPFAKEAAPYLHAKLASIEANVNGVIGQYAAQPVPVEEREPMKPNGHATGH
jgi:hypothetical protein